DDAVTVEVVALADLAVEVRGRVSGARVVEIELRVVGAGDPVVRSAPLPGLAVGGPGLRAGLARLRHGVGAPALLPGLQVPAVDVPANAELTACGSGDEGVLDDQRGERGALAGTHVA